MRLLSRIEDLLRHHLPDPIRRSAGLAVRLVSRPLYAGRGVECPACGHRARAFAPRHGKPNQRCVRCGALARHRLLALLLRDRLDLLDKPMRVLHLAPDPGLAAMIQASPRVEYVSGDLDPRPGQKRIDVTRIAEPEASFDLVICSHVLEHVAEDRRAIRELFRILRPDGHAIVVVPIKAPVTLEYAAHDHSGHSPRHQHVRTIGLDYDDRLREAGFKVDPLDLATQFTPAHRRRYGVAPGELIFVCRKLVPAHAEASIAIGRLA